MTERHRNAGARSGPATAPRNNFPQGRVTDHRIHLTLHKIDNIMNGDLDELIDALTAADQSAKLAESAKEAS